MTYSFKNEQNFDFKEFSNIRVISLPIAAKSSLYQRKPIKKRVLL